MSERLSDESVVRSLVSIATLGEDEPVVCRTKELRDVFADLLEARAEIAEKQQRIDAAIRQADLSTGDLPASDTAEELLGKIIAILKGEQHEQA